MHACVRLGVQELKENLELWGDFVDTWAEEERVRMKTVFKDLNGGYTLFYKLTSRINARAYLVSPPVLAWDTGESAEVERKHHRRTSSLILSAKAVQDKLFEVDLLLCCGTLRHA